MKPRLCFLSILGAPGSYDPTVYADVRGCDDETIWIEDLLDREELAGRVEYRGVKVALGERLPDLRDADIFILGGSYHSVHERLDWQQAITAWLRTARSAAVPLLGICGGHQMIAESLGGTVNTIDGGPMAGSLEIELTPQGAAHPLFAGCDAPPVYHFANYEHVDTVPDGARVLASRPGVPHAALDYGGGWCSIQFHPESTEQSMVAAWSRSRPDLAARYRHLPRCGRLIRNFVDVVAGAPQPAA